MILNAIRERFSQYLGIAAIVLLLAIPFLNTARLMDSASTVTRAAASKAVPVGSITDGFGGERRIPAYDELEAAVERVRAARIKLLKAAAAREGQDIELAARGYRDELAACAAAFHKLRDRLYPDESRALRAEFSTGDWQDERGHRLLAWELEWDSPLPR